MENWKSLNGIVANGENYEVSDLGNVRNANTGKVLKPYATGCNNKYLKVDLLKDGKRKKYRVHRLVAIAFLPNPDCKEDVNHIDFNTRNNALHNLEWTTHLENIQWNRFKEVH